MPGTIWTQSNRQVDGLRPSLVVTPPGLVLASARGTPIVSAGGGSLGEPIYQAGVDSLQIADSFDSYTTVSSLHGPYLISGTVGKSIITGRGGVGKAVRFSYGPGANDDCFLDYDWGTPVRQRLVVTYWFRTSDGADPTKGDTNGSGIKWMEVWRPVGARWTNGVGLLTSTYPNQHFTVHDNGSPDQPNPLGQNVSELVQFAGTGRTNDGNWHRYTLYQEVGLPGGTGGARIWIDGTLVLNGFPGGPGVPVDGYTHDSTGFSRIKWPDIVVPGGDAVPSQWAFTIDIDDLTVWTPATSLV